MKLKEANETLAAIGCKVSYSPDTREYRVNVKGGTEATAYYSSSLEDVIVTARREWSKAHV